MLPFLAENVLWCIIWFWLCFCGCGAILSFISRHSTSLGRYDYLWCTLCFLSSSCWVLGTLQSCSFVSNSLECAGWSVWVTRVLGQCGLACVFAQVIRELFHDRWREDIVSYNIWGVYGVFALVSFFTLVIPYDPFVSKSPCIPSLSYELAFFVFSSAFYAYGFAQAMKASAFTVHERLTTAEAFYDACFYDPRTRKVCAYSALFLVVLSIPSSLHLFWDFTHATAYQALGLLFVCIAVFYWPAISFVGPLYGYALGNSRFLSGQLAISQVETEDLHEVLEDITLERDWCVKKFLDHCKEMNVVRTKNVSLNAVRRFIKYKGADQCFRFFVAVMVRQDIVSTRDRIAFTQDILTHFVASKKIQLSADASELLMAPSDESMDYQSEVFFDRYLIVLNRKFDAACYNEWLREDWETTDAELNERLALMEGRGALRV
jgi:hypothetical protein